MTEEERRRAQSREQKDPLSLNLKPIPHLINLTNLMNLKAQAGR